MIKRFLKTYPHFLWALYFLAYGLFFALMESIDFSPETFHLMYHPLDDKIPFCEWFVLFYYLWYAFLAIPALHLLFREGAAFRRYIWFVGLGFSLSLVFYLIYPNFQNLRPDLTVLGRENIFTEMIGAIYSIDTNTNVCPSMHVIGSFGVMFSIFDAKSLRKTVWMPILGVVIAIGISASTVFCKQHSIVDVFWGVIASAILFAIVYLWLGRYADRLEARHKKKAEQSVTAVNTEE